jgi:hypothetical protein
MESAVSPRPSAAAVPALLWAAGVLILPLLTAGEAWPLALGWAAAGLLLLALWRALAGRPRARAITSAALIPVLVLLTFEGGLFLIPAAVAGIVVSARQLDE